MVYYQLLRRATDSVVAEFDHEIDAEIALIESDDLEAYVVRRIEIKEPSIIERLTSWVTALLG